MTNNETEFNNQDEEILYKDMWEKLKKDLANELFDWGDFDCPYTVSLRDFLGRMNALENKTYTPRETPTFLRVEK